MVSGSSPVSKHFFVCLYFNKYFFNLLFEETYRRLEKGAAILEKELTETKLAYEESMEKVKSLENTLQSSFK